MNKIKNVSLFFRIIFQILFIGFPVLLAIAWITSPQSLVLAHGMINMSFIPQSYANEILHVLTLEDKILGFCVSALPMAVNLFILYSLIKLFKLYEKGEIFSINNVRYIRNVGYGLLATQLINPIYEGLMGVVLTRLNPPGHHFASVTLDQSNLGVLFMGLIVILISWIMTEGCKLREEQQLTI